LRHDIRKSTEFDWVLGGQIDNNEYYDELYLEKYYNSIDVASDLVKYIDHLILLSKKLGFKLLMTYMFEPWIDNYLGEPVFSTEIVRRNIKDLKNSKYLKSLEEFTKTEYWINPSIESFCLKNSSNSQLWADLDDINIIEHHPSPYQHLLYAKQISNLISIDFGNKYDSIALELDKFLSIEDNSRIFRDKVNRGLFYKNLENILNYL